MNIPLITRKLKQCFTLYRNHLRNVTNKSKVDTASCPNPHTMSSDMVGPADPVSNLRRVICRRLPDETPLERQYREKRREVQEWNHQFWSKHNTNFFQERDLFIKKNLPSDKQTLTADEMSVFYKAFLDRNWKSHVAYNAEWYRRNLQLLGLAVAVKFNRFFKR